MGQLAIAGRRPGKRLRADPEYRLILGYCVDKGIPLSRFQSWPEDDQDAVVALLLARADACPRCGTWPDEWADEDRYEATVVHCRGCELLDQQEGNLAETARERPSEARGRRVALRR